MSYEEIKWAFAKLEIENEQLKKENEQLRQQVRDITCHPLRPRSGPIYWCNSCMSPVAGTAIKHVCQ